MPREWGTTVVVVGGGLAGLTASLELVRLGYHVQLHEAGAQLGGKARSDYAPPLIDAAFQPDARLRLPEGVASDHGYHVFPMWYVNMRQLWAEIGLTPDQVCAEGDFVVLPPAIGGAQQAYVPKPAFDPRQVLGICDLLLQPEMTVDTLTLQGFLYSRDFHRAEHPIQIDDFILNALTIGEQDVSARTVRDFFRQWIPVFTQPNSHALAGSLDRVLIQPLRARIEAVARANGCSFEVRLGSALTRLSTTASGGPLLAFTDASGRPSIVEDALTVLALPLERLRGLLDPAAHDAIPEVPRLHALRANTFAALDVHFTRRLPVTAQTHFILRQSPLRITGLDISRHWPELQAQERTVLQFVIANATALNGLDDATFTRVVAQEIGRYIPEVGTRDVAFYVPHHNVSEPLFVNDVGGWANRPNAASQLPGLYFAGDYVRTETDVTSMESAVRSGLQAAEALRAAHRPDAPTVNILPPPALPPALQALVAQYPNDPVLARLQCMMWLGAAAAAAAQRSATLAVTAPAVRGAPPGAP